MYGVVRLMMNDQSHWSAVVIATHSIRISIGKISAHTTQVIPWKNRQVSSWQKDMVGKSGTTYLPSSAVNEPIEVDANHGNITPGSTHRVASG
jgi:hypothetical protein